LFHGMLLPDDDDDDDDWLEAPGIFPVNDDYD
jgi:hypothetical protein